MAITPKESAVNKIRLWRSQIDHAVTRYKNGTLSVEEMKRIQREYTIRIEAVQSVFKSIS